VIRVIDGKPVKEIQNLMWNSVQVPAGGSESVTIIRFPQECMIKIQLK
jgi:hypothetical protein